MENCHLCNHLDEVIRYEDNDYGFKIRVCHKCAFSLTPKQVATKLINRGEIKPLKEDNK